MSSNSCGAWLVKGSSLSADTAGAREDRADQIEQQLQQEIEQVEEELCEAKKRLECRETGEQNAEDLEDEVKKLKTVMDLKNFKISVSDLVKTKYERIDKDYILDEKIQAKAR